MQQEKKKINLKELQFHMLNNQYKIGQIIGEGGYGCIFYAQNKKGERRAIKVVDMNLKSQSIIKCLQKQDKAMKMIHAQNVIQCYDSKFDFSRNLNYIVMDLCNSLSLWHLIVYKGHLLQIQAKIYLKNILAGLISMFRFGYSHRDIKSSNICLKNGSCIIIDLGCTKQFSNELGSGFNKSKTMISRVGSIMTKSPEMLRKEKYTYRTDLWAVGILYYQMLCGVTPFHLTGEQKDEQAIECITNNIQKIYDESYIEKRIKQSYSDISSSFQFRANKKISLQAKQFLSKLIVLQPMCRLNEQGIKKSPYLRQNIQISQKNYWQAVQCLLPLKDINWQQFVEQLEKQQSLQKAQCQNDISQLQKQKFSNFVVQMMAGERRQISQNYQNKLEQDKVEINRVRYLDFQIKRIILLMKLRKFLKKAQSSNPKLMCYQAVLKISQYCHLNLAQIIGAARQYNIGLYSTSKNTKIKNNYLLEYISDIYLEDVKEWQKSNGWKKKKIQQISAEQTYNELFQRMKNQGIKISKDWICFFQNYKKILNYVYIPSVDCPEWIPWSSFRFILQVASNN